MMVYRAKLEKKQAFLFRLVDIANELFAISASVSRGHAISIKGGEEAESAIALADDFCRGSARHVDELFRSLWHNDDLRSYEVAMDVLQGGHLWMEELLAGVDAQPNAEAQPTDADVAVGSSLQEAGVAT